MADETIIKLTDEQKKQMKAATGQEHNEFKVETVGTQLSPRVAPKIATRRMAKKALAKKAVAKRTLAKKAVAKRTLAKKAVAKRTLAKKAVAKRTLAKKVAAKR